MLRLHYTQVVKAVESLPEAQRVAMVLVAVEGMSYRETGVLSFSKLTNSKVTSSLITTLRGPVPSRFHVPRART